ncbi:hypothetical protein GT347_15485 [Xylophilus rhododendri]|uniref:Uncharacterized protein n=1 Tax=Xylophilus rhododendri TaxID=2697032 RepID=A0A857J5H6_9BURK|nr:hypothetical protein [Xylophilus rhododendri]QHI99254.1 hypothetical protein GT347_15485 [Xylophilus rhododendri]
MKFTLSAMAAILATIILWAHHDPMLLAHVDQSDGDADTAPAMAASGPAAEDSKDPPNISAELLRRYNAGGDMRAFFSYALQHPEQGGYFYAVKFMRQCQDSADKTETGDIRPVADHPAAEIVKSHHMHLARKQLQMRCADFVSEEISRTRARDLWSSGLSQDPLVKAVAEYHASFEQYSRDPAQAARLGQAVTQVLRMEDPLVFEDLGWRLALQPRDGGKGFMLNGNFHPLDSDTDVASALYLLPCGTGLQCDRHEFDVALRCAAGEDCDASRFERVERMLRTRPGSYGRVLTAYESMRTAVALGDTQFFDRR